MTTIAQQEMTYAQMLDDLVGELLAFGTWTDADTSIDNAGNSDDWTDNGRVLEHSDTGQYVLFFLSRNVWASGRSGIRIVVSNDWDSSKPAPAGYTTVTGDDPMSGQVNNHQSGSYNTHSGKDRTPGLMAYADNSIPGEYDSNMQNLRELPVTYFGSARSDGFTMACWDTQHATHGCASALCYEYVGQKFWADGTDPWVMYGGNSDFGAVGDWYGWEANGDNTSGVGNDRLVSNNAAAQRGNWGYINPDSNDDTFFFRRPTLYQTANRKYPVGFLHDTIRNDTNEGAAHGDIITHDGTDYRIVRQSGAGVGTILSCGLRYE